MYHVSAQGVDERIIIIIKTKKMSKYFHLQASFGCSVDNWTKKAPFGFKFELLLVHSLQMKSKKRLAGNVFETFAAHSSLVHDITDTDSLAQNGSTHGSVIPTFKCQFLTGRNQVKNCWAFLFIPNRNQVKKHWASLFLPFQADKNQVKNH